MAFIKRNAFDPNHYYTEFINSSWRPGGGIFILNLKDGNQRELFPRMSGGVFGRFDISFDAKRIVFSYKKSAGEGFRIYSAEIDGSELKQLTFPEPDEAEAAKKFRRGGYHSGTDDMDPCWLPDGGIAFVSTRPRYGVLCDPSDDLTVSTMYRMEADGSGMKRLSYGALSENSPCVLPDGRIMYTRWEYVDKGASAVKCLWAMRPDGTGSSEIYGNDTALPVTMIFGRPMPGGRGKYVFIGAPHYPQGPNGTVITADTSKGTRSESAMRHITPDVEIRDESGYHFKKGGEWKFDPSGKSGRLFRDPYPISDGEFLAAMKPEGYAWNDAGGYELALLSSDGSARRIYRDEKYSAFQPVPVVPRPLPPVLPSAPDEGLERRNLAALLITDVYAGLENVPRGAAKYVRVLEQIARPWGANRIAMGGEKTEDAPRSAARRDKPVHALGAESPARRGGNRARRQRVFFGSRQPQHIFAGFGRKLHGAANRADFRKLHARGNQELYRLPRKNLRNPAVRKVGAGSRAAQAAAKTETPARGGVRRKTFRLRRANPADFRQALRVVPRAKPEGKGPRPARNPDKIFQRIVRIPRPRLRLAYKSPKRLRICGRARRHDKHVEKELCEARPRAARQNHIRNIPKGQQRRIPAGGQPRGADERFGSARSPPMPRI